MALVSGWDERGQRLENKSVCNETIEWNRESMKYVFDEREL